MANPHGFMMPVPLLARFAGRLVNCRLPRLVGILLAIPLVVFVGTLVWLMIVGADFADAA